MPVLSTRTHSVLVAMSSGEGRIAPGYFVHYWANKSDCHGSRCRRDFLGNLSAWDWRFASCLACSMAMYCILFFGLCLKTYRVVLDQLEDQARGSFRIGVLSMQASNSSIIHVFLHPILKHRQTIVPIQTHSHRTHPHAVSHVSSWRFACINTNQSNQLLNIDIDAHVSKIIEAFITHTRVHTCILARTISAAYAVALTTPISVMSPAAVPLVSFTE